MALQHHINFWFPLKGPIIKYGIMTNFHTFYEWHFCIEFHFFQHFVSNFHRLLGSAAAQKHIRLDWLVASIAYKKTRFCNLVRKITVFEQFHIRKLIKISDLFQKSITSCLQFQWMLTKLLMRFFSFLWNKGRRTCYASAFQNNTTFTSNILLIHLLSTYFSWSVLTQTIFQCL